MSSRNLSYLLRCVLDFSQFEFLILKIGNPAFFVIHFMTWNWLEAFWNIWNLRGCKNMMSQNWLEVLWKVWKFWGHFILTRFFKLLLRKKWWKKMSYKSQLSKDQKLFQMGCQSHALPLPGQQSKTTRYLEKKPR